MVSHTFSPSLFRSNNSFMVSLLCSPRGETFRKEFLVIGEARSLIPRMMALTATATKITRQQVCRRLGMVKPVLVTASPNRPNIKFIVQPADNIEETFSPLVEELRRLCVMLKKTIYCVLSHV